MAARQRRAHVGQLGAARDDGIEFAHDGDAVGRIGRFRGGPSLVQRDAGVMGDGLQQRQLAPAPDGARHDTVGAQRAQTAIAQQQRRGERGERRAGIAKHAFQARARLGRELLPGAADIGRLEGLRRPQREGHAGRRLAGGQPHTLHHQRVEPGAGKRREQLALDIPAEQDARSAAGDGIDHGQHGGLADAAHVAVPHDSGADVLHGGAGRFQGGLAGKIDGGG